MSLRLPGNIGNSAGQEAAQSLIDTEILGEMASALGNAGRKVDLCMQRLRSCPADDPARAGLVRASAEAVFAYFVQREICGFRRHDDVIREYGIPREVLVRLGAR